MSKNILNNQESFTRTKKKLKKLLEEKGLKLTLCETSDILAKALGFKNTFDMNKNYFESNKIENNQMEDVIGYNENHKKQLDSIMKKPSEGLKMIAGRNIDGMSNHQKNIKQIVSIKKEKDGDKIKLNIDIKLPYNQFSPKFNDELIENLSKSIQDLKGHIIITGKAGVGKTTLMRKLKRKKSILSFGDINEIEFDPEEEVFNHQHLDTINNSKKNIIFCIHECRNIDVLENIKKINSDFNTNSVQYIINIKVLKESEKNIDCNIESYHFMEDDKIIKEDITREPYKIEDTPEINIKTSNGRVIITGISGGGNTALIRKLINEKFEKKE